MLTREQQKEAIRSLEGHLENFAQALQLEDGDRKIIEAEDVKWRVKVTKENGRTIMEFIVEFFVTYIDKVLISITGRCSSRRKTSS